LACGVSLGGYVFVAGLGWGVVCAVGGVYVWGSCYVACLYLGVAVLLCSCIWWSVLFGFFGYGLRIILRWVGGVLRFAVWGFGGGVELVNLFALLGSFYLCGWCSGFRVCVGLWVVLCTVLVFERYPCVGFVSHVVGGGFVRTVCGVVFFFCRWVLGLLRICGVFWLVVYCCTSTAILLFVWVCLVGLWWLLTV